MDLKKPIRRDPKNLATKSGMNKTHIYQYSGKGQEKQMTELEIALVVQ